MEAVTAAVKATLAATTPSYLRAWTSVRLKISRRSLPSLATSDSYVHIVVDDDVGIGSATSGNSDNGNGSDGDQSSRWLLFSGALPSLLATRYLAHASAVLIVHHSRKTSMW